MNHPPSSVCSGDVSRLGSTVSVPMAVAERSAELTVYREDPTFSGPSNNQVYVQASAQSHHEETHQTQSGQYVTHTETRETLNPLITPSQPSGPAVIREEKLPATVSTKAYEVFRQDPATLFPGAKIVSIGKMGPVTTPSGCVYDPASNTITSAFNGQVTQVQQAHHIGSTFGRYPDMPTSIYQPVVTSVGVTGNHVGSVGSSAAFLQRPPMYQAMSQAAPTYTTPSTTQSHAMPAYMPAFPSQAMQGSSFDGESLSGYYSSANAPAPMDLTSFEGYPGSMLGRVNTTTTQQVYSSAQQPATYTTTSSQPATYGNTIYTQRPAGTQVYSHVERREVNTPFPTSSVSYMQTSPQKVSFSNVTPMTHYAATPATQYVRQPSQPSQGGRPTY